jgi:hypothetical protein
MAGKYGDDVDLDTWSPQDRQAYFDAVDRDMAAKEAPAAAPSSSLADRIKGAVSDLQGSPQRDGVRLSALRAALPDVDRAALDAELTRMRDSGDAILMNLDNPRDIEAERAAAIPDRGRLLSVLWMKADRSLAQGGEAARGRITLGDGKALIRLFGEADASTFMHEAGHLWLDELARDAADERVGGAIKRDFRKVLDWLGVDKAEDIGTAEHEKWATTFERYLADGKAPSKALARAFERFREWLGTVYRSLTGLGAPVGDEVRGVMDRMLATDREIAERGGGNDAAIRAATTPEAIDKAFVDPAVHEAAEADLRRSIEQGRNRVPVAAADGSGKLGFADAELHEADMQHAMAAEVRGCAAPRPGGGRVRNWQLAQKRKLTGMLDR